MIQLLEARRLFAVDIHVDQHAPGLTQDGTSWENAYLNLQSALAIAQNGDRILVANGKYYPTAGADRAISFVLVDGVSLLGGYAGYGAADPDARDVDANLTSLSGDLGTTGVNTDNSYHVLTGTNLTAATVVDGVSIRDGNANGFPSHDNGGGMLLTSSSLQISQCRFLSNRASTSGAAIHLASGSPAISNCEFSFNTTTYNGGCLNLTGAGSPAVSNCAFAGNTGYVAGAIRTRDSISATINDSSFTQNTGQYGGAIAIEMTSAITANDCTFLDNNSTYLGGALYYQSYGTTVSQFTDCQFFANFAMSNGGGVYMGNANLQIVNSSFVGNFSQTGGGAYIQNGALINCTLAYNESSSLADGVYIGQSGPGSVTNCIIWGDNASNTINSPGAPHTTITYSDVRGFTNLGLTNINTDPYFLRTPAPGGDGAWGTADDDYGDLRLTQVVFPSPRPIDSGSNAAVPAGITTDLAGEPRFIDYPGLSSGAIVDMGAYERQPTLSVASGTFNYETSFGVYLLFNGIVWAPSVSAGDLTILNETTGNSYVPTFGGAPGQQPRGATWVLPTGLPDGNYTATLPAGSVNDTAGNPIRTGYSFSFFILAGDANRDRRVNSQDFNALAGHFGMSGQTFSQGNLDYDGMGLVDSVDFTVFAGHYGSQLPAPSPGPFATMLPSAPDDELL